MGLDAARRSLRGLAVFGDAVFSLLGEVVHGSKASHPGSGAGAVAKMGTHVLGPDAAVGCVGHTVAGRGSCRRGLSGFGEAVFSRFGKVVHGSKSSHGPKASTENMREKDSSSGTRRNGGEIGGGTSLGILRGGLSLASPPRGILKDLSIGRDTEERSGCAWTGKVARGR